MPPVLAIGKILKSLPLQNGNLYALRPGSESELYLSTNLDEITHTCWDFHAGFKCYLAFCAGQLFPEIIRNRTTVLGFYHRKL